jgi:hypothetical protein
MDNDQIHKDLDRVLEMLQASSSSTESGPEEQLAEDSLLRIGLPDEHFQRLVKATACANCQASIWQLSQIKDGNTTAISYCRTLLQHTFLPGVIMTRRCGSQQPVRHEQK